MKQMLIEAYQNTKKISGTDPSKPHAIREIVCDDRKFGIYRDALSEGLNKADKRDFSILCNNTRRALMENSMYSLNPYETLALPILRVFFPKTIARELVTVIPMDKPEIIRGFLRATFERYGDANVYGAPSNTDISGGPKIGVPVTASAAVGNTTDILAVAGLTSDVAHIEKTFEITAVRDVGNNTVQTSITPTVDGEFSASVEINGVTDVITGNINYHDGTLNVASVDGVAVEVDYRASVSLEENTINPRAKLSIDKMRLVAKDRQISTEWSIQMEQDIKALFNINVQAELVSVIGQQIVLDIDREVVNSLIYSAERLAGASHVDSFSKTAPPTFTWGPKQWMENVIPTLNTLSAQIYTDTNIAAGNTLACNPLDAAIFESFQDYKFTGKSDQDGDVGYESATVASGKFKILISAVVPQGKTLMIYKPVEEMKSVFVFAPYVPCVLSPYPLGNKPSLTVLSRYGTQLIRPQGIAVLNITA